MTSALEAQVIRGWNKNFDLNFIPGLNAVVHDLIFQQGLLPLNLFSELQNVVRAAFWDTYNARRICYNYVIGTDFYLANLKSFIERAESEFVAAPPWAIGRRPDWITRSSNFINVAASSPYHCPTYTTKLRKP
jgi:hypothetical protein